MERLIRNFAIEKDLIGEDDKRLSIMRILNILIERNIISVEFYKAFRSIWEVRNIIAHGGLLEYDSLIKSFEISNILLQELKDIFQPIQV